MIYLDGTIFSLQKNGGVSVYTREIATRLTQTEQNTVVAVYDEDARKRSSVSATVMPKRPLERYRDFSVDSRTTIAHSPYYRRPEHKSTPLVITVHDFIYERYLRGLKRWVHHTQKAAAIRRAAVILCVSESTKADLLHFFPEVQESKLFVTHLATAPAFGNHHSGSNDSRTPYVLFVGNRQGYKNFEATVRAVGQIADFSLYAVGGGPLSAAETQLVSSELGARFKHFTGIDDTTLATLYSDAFCLAYPSLYEGFGIPVIEAMSCGCPVIATNSSSIPEVAGGAAILLDRGEPGELREALRGLQVDGFRQYLIEAGRKNVARFSWQKTFESTLAAYRTLL